MRRIMAIYQKYQADRQKRAEAKARFWVSRRRQVLAYRRRRARLLAASPLEKARLERKERRRQEKLRDRYQGASGILININASLRRQEGSSGVWGLLAVVLVALVLAMFLLSLPVMMMLGFLSIFAEYLFKLPGMKLITNFILSITCSDAGKWISKQLEGKGIIGTVGGWIGDGAGWAAGQVKNAFGNNFITQAVTFPLTATATMGELFKTVTSSARAFHLMLCSILQDKNSVLASFKEKGGVKPFEAALNCANWDTATMGDIDSTKKFNIDEWRGSFPGDSAAYGKISATNTDKKGNRQFCLEGKQKREDQGKVPNWLITIYQAAAEEYNVPWELLAAINWNDTNYGGRALNEKQEDNKLKVDEKYSNDMEELRKIAGGKKSGSKGTGAILNNQGMSDWELRNDPTVKALMPSTDPQDIRDTAQSALDAATQVGSEWQVPNPTKNNRVGWIPFTRSEWLSVDEDQGGTPLDWQSSPYQNTLRGAPQACPGPVDVDGKLAVGPPGAGATANDLPKQAQLSDIGTYPGDDAPKSEIAQWMADAAVKVGLPPQAPVMAALVESSLTNDPRPIDHDSTGFFQMRLSIWDSGRYKGYTKKPKLQLLWFLDQALKVARNDKYKGEVPTDDKGLGEFIADVENPAAEYRDRYEKKGDEARKLIKGGSKQASDSSVDVSFRSDGDADTCDPVDSIFALAHWLSKRGARGDVWRGAIPNDVDGITNSEIVAGGAGPVFVEGDSLSVDSKKQIFKNFGKNIKEKDFDAKQSRPVATGIERIRARKDNLPATLIFALGANNLDDSDATFRSHIEQVMDIAGESRCVVWPTVYSGGPHFVNVLKKAAKKHKNLVVPEWHAVAPQHVADDRTHFKDEEAADAYADKLLQGASKCTSSAPTSTKKKGITGKNNEMVLEGTSERPIVYAGATLFGDIWPNKPGQIPRKGSAPVERDEVDAAYNYKTACEGGGGSIEKESHRKFATHRYPAVAIKIKDWRVDSTKHACGYWLITAPNGKSMKVMQADIGPGANGVHIDVNGTLAQELGYKPSYRGGNFPNMNGVWRAEYLGKKRPADVNKPIGGQGKPSDGVQKAIEDEKPPKSFREDAVPPLDELKKKNPDLPSASWVHSPVPPLKDKFPSFDTGLEGAKDKGEGCGTVSPKAQNGVFFSAAKAFKIPWQVLAAYAAVTSGYGCEGGIYSHYKGSYATDADGNGRFQMGDPVDGTFSTARSLYALGGSENLAQAARKMTPDREMLAEVAGVAGQLGLATPGFYLLMDDAISEAVQERNHTIDKDLCADMDKYVDCIADLYRQIRGVDPAVPDGGLTGGCDPPPVPDTELEPFSLNKEAEQASSKAYFKIPAQEKGLMVAASNGDGGPRSWARRDAYAGSMAAIKTFLACKKDYKKNWKTNNRYGDWGAGDVKDSWAFPGFAANPEKHKTHRNGADNDLNIDGVTNMEAMNGRNYSRKDSIILMKMLLRAGAYKVIFEDPKVRDEVTKERQEYGKKNPEVVKKLKDHWVDVPNYDTGDGYHHDHFHIHWYIQNKEAGKGRSMPNPVPADVKIWITGEGNTGSSGGEDDSSPYDQESSGSDAKGATEYAKDRKGKVAFSYVAKAGQMEGYGLSSGFTARGLISVMVAVRFLQKKDGDDLSGEDKKQLKGMLVDGDESDAQALFKKGGGADGLDDVASEMGLTNFTAEDQWKETGVTPANMARVFGSALNKVPDKYSSELQKLLEDATAATNWGIPKAWPEPKWGLGKGVGEAKDEKDGKMKPVVHQCAFEGPRKSLTVICVLTEKNPSVEYGKETVEGIAERLNPANNVSSCEGYPLATKGEVGQGPNQKGGTHDPGADPNNWQSDNALDILVDRNTPVLATGDGTIVKVSGSAPKPGGDRFAGFAITLKTSDNQIFYTHLMSVKVKAGDKVKQGDEIGKSGYAADVDHLHIGVEKGDPSKMFDCEDAGGGSDSGGGGDKGGGKDDGSKGDPGSNGRDTKFGTFPPAPPMNPVENKNATSMRYYFGTGSGDSPPGGPIPGWCWFHFKNPGCGATVNYKDYKKRAEMILKKMGCTTFSGGRCKTARNDLVEAQKNWVKYYAGAETASQGKAKLLTEVRPSDVTGAAAPSDPYTPK